MRRLHHHRTLIVMILAATTLARPASLLTGASAKAQLGGTTRIHLVDPVTNTGLAAGYRIIKTVRHDHCGRGVPDVSGSLFTCGLSEHANIGPCWAGPPGGRSGRATAICLRYPWSKKAVQVDLDYPLVTHRSRIDLAKPWGFTLSTSAKCVAFGGAVGSFHGKPEFYDCPRRNNRLDALSPLDRVGQPWTAQTVRFDHAHLNLPSSAH